MGLLYYDNIELDSTCQLKIGTNAKIILTKNGLAIYNLNNVTSTLTSSHLELGFQSSNNGANIVVYGSNNSKTYYSTLKSDKLSIGEASDVTPTSITNSQLQIGGSSGSTLTNSQLQIGSSETKSILTKEFLKVPTIQVYNGYYEMEQLIPIFDLDPEYEVVSGGTFYIYCSFILKNSFFLFCRYKSESGGAVRVKFNSFPADYFQLIGCTATHTFYNVDYDEDNVIQFVNNASGDCIIWGSLEYD